MRIVRAFWGGVIVSIALLGTALQARADHLPGMGDLSGKVTGGKPGLLASVYALNTDKDVGFMVFVVDGEYRAVNLFPGNYEVTIRPAVGQVFTDGFEQQTVKLKIVADAKATADFALKSATYEPDYVGGMTYKGGWSDDIDAPPSVDAKVEPYNVIYPPGRGRDIMERACMGCHTVQFFSYNFDRKYASGRPVHDKAGWAITVDRMSKGVSFNNRSKAPNFDVELLPPADREVLIDYLNDNFGENALPRVVQLESEPELDDKALAKVQFVEYRSANNAELPKRGAHTLGFDPDGNVFASDRAGNGGVLVWINPQTGEHRDYAKHGGYESLVVDVDGTVWYGGLRHFDPKTDLHDDYKFEGPKGGRAIGVSTQIFDSNGDLWLSQLGGGGIAKWDRKIDSISWWDVPIYRSRPYGITLDHNDKVWFAEYHNSAIASFDPKTQTFKNYKITEARPTNIRRLGADSKNFIWTATWGSEGMQNGALYRLNPDTGAVDEHKLGIPYSNPYDAAPDDDDNIWVPTDNYLVMFDQKTKKFTRYPVTVRTDIPRLAITEAGAIWFCLRNAGYSAGYGAAAAVLYPDKDKIKTYAARYSDKSVHSHIRRYKGPPTKITGVTKFSPAAEQNPGAYAAAMGLAANAPTNKGGTAVLPGGSAIE